MQIMSGALYLLNRFQVSSVSFANIDIFFYNSLVSSLRTSMHQLCHVCFKLGVVIVCRVSGFCILAILTNQIFFIYFGYVI